MKTALIAATAVGLSFSLLWAQENLPVTKEKQAALNPDKVMMDLAEGNKRFVAGKTTEPNVKARVKASTDGQYPKAYILSCIDSRVPVEQVFDQGLGDIFVGRVAGNVENGDQLGSMEFAAAVSGVKVIMVLGHEACGAVKGACDHVKLGNLTGLLANIEPAMKKVEGYEEKGRNSKNKEFVAEVVKMNVAETVADIRKRSEVLAALEKEGKIKIVGGVYSLHTGEVTVLK